MKYAVIGLAAVLGFTSCGTPAPHAAEAPVIRPNEVADFRLLYGQNCSGCHGTDGQGGLSVSLGDPVYLAIADDPTIRRITAEGVPRTAMPAFAQASGGLLTEAQIDILVRGIRARWAIPDAFDKDKPPAYAAPQAGDAARGHNVFTASCSSCHGPDGRSGRAIAEGSYLELVSDQHLRTVVITGMPHLGMPDWRNHGKTLSDADVTDVVAWLVAQRMPLSARLSHPGGSK